MIKKDSGKKLKTFNLDGKLYKEFSEHCRKYGISMSRRIENFIREELRRMKGGIRVVEQKVKNMGEEVEHSFKKYC